MPKRYVRCEVIFLLSFMPHQFWGNITDRAVTTHQYIAELKSDMSKHGLSYRKAENLDSLHSTDGPSENQSNLLYFSLTCSKSNLNQS